YAWRVPPLPSSDARLAVRVNLEGREVLAGVSEPFRIAAGRAAGASPSSQWPMRIHGGELWVTGDDRGADDPGAPFELHPAASERRMAGCWLGLAPVFPPSPRPASNRPAVVPAGEADQGAAAVPVAGADCRQPLISPLRI
ncbi:MAG: hypothetical protein JOZ15_03610, partial [Acidobacteria bacterium]|nr:hypothetical protein [Acidobacteriota bacterium]